jgi:hypothetical protein
MRWAFYRESGGFLERDNSPQPVGFRSAAFFAIGGGNRASLGTSDFSEEIWERVISFQCGDLSGLRISEAVPSGVERSPQ